MRAAVCGAVTADGGRCQNPPGCTVAHRNAGPASGPAVPFAPADLARPSGPGGDPIGPAGGHQGSVGDAVVQVAELLGSVVAARDEYGEDPDVPDLETDLADLVAGLGRRSQLPPDIQERAVGFVDRYDRYGAEFAAWVEAGGRGVDESERLDRQRDRLTVEGVAIAEEFFYEHASPADLAGLAGHPNPDARRLAAQHPRCPAEARAHAGLLSG